jgi:branched-chain amino acid transport system substrate-binding protein
MKMTKSQLSLTRRLAGAVFGLGLLVTALPALAQEKEPVVLGFVTGLSGEGAEYGQRAVNIGQLFTDMMNEQGGIDGRKVEMAVGDSQDQADILLSLGKRYLLERNVTAFFGTGNSGVTLAFSKAMRNTKVPIMMHYTWGNENTSPQLPSAFRVGPNNAIASGLLAKYLEKAGYKNVVILAEQSAYGTDFAEGLTEAVGDKFKLRTISYEPQILDLSPVLLSLAQEEPQPDALVTAGNYQIIYNLQNQVPAAGLKSQIIGSWDYPSTPVFWNTAGENGIGIIYATFSSPDIPLTDTGKNFKKIFEDKFDRSPVFYEYFLWDCLNAVKAGVEASGSVEPAVLTDAIAKVNFEGTMGPLTFTRDEERGIWNQGLTGNLYMKTFTKVGDTDEGAKVIASVSP